MALSERFELRLDQDTLEGVDAWRAKQPGVPSRSEAIRRLVERGLVERDSVHFSPGEKLLVHMVCDLLKGQKIKTDFDADFIQDALLGGHLWALEWQMRGTFHNHVDNTETVSEVANILDMWDLIEASFEELDKKGKALVEAEAGVFGKDPKFRGFDGNNESEHMGIAIFFVEKMGRFARFKAREMNSHFPTSLEGYRRMLAVFEPIRDTLIGTLMTPQQLAKVLNERVHPSQRGKKK